MTKPPIVAFRNFAIKKNGLYSQNISCISTNTSRYTNVTGCSGGNHMASGARGDGATRVPTCVPSNVQRSYISLPRTAPSSDPRDSNPWKVHTGCPRRNMPDFGKVFLMLKYTDITQNTYVQIWTVTEIMSREVWNFDSCYTLIDYQIHIKTGRNMWFL